MPLGDPRPCQIELENPFRGLRPISTGPEETIAPSARELALECEVEALKAELKSTRRERNQFARQLYTLGEVLGQWAQDSTKHMRDEAL